MSLCSSRSCISGEGYEPLDGSIMPGKKPCSCSSINKLIHYRRAHFSTFIWCIPITRSQGGFSFLVWSLFLNLVVSTVIVGYIFFLVCFAILLSLCLPNLRLCLCGIGFCRLRLSSLYSTSESYLVSFSV